MDRIDDTTTVTIRQAPRDEPTLREVSALLVDAYWNTRFDRPAIELAHRHSTAFFVAEDGSGRVVGSIRALSDVGKRAFLFDAIVAPEHRRRGIGQRLVSAVLAHPAVRDTPIVALRTRDAVSLYARFGFVVSNGTSLNATGIVDMVLERGLGKRAEDSRPR